MKQKYVIAASGVSFVLGIIFFLFYQEILVLRSPTGHVYQSVNHAIKKEVALWYWHEGAWHQEKEALIWRDESGDAIYYLINAWLNFLDDEDLIEKKVNVQSVLISAAGHEAYISFDRNPFAKQSSTFMRWLLIEGILKTIRENNIPVQSIQFLVHHKQLNDPHLDFSKSWPIIGFFDQTQSV